MEAFNDVLFTEIKGKGGDLGLITLNRPSVLNSLNHDMIVAMRDQLQAWAKRDDIKAVVITAAEGRAFCAGGDIRLTYERAIANDPAASTFFYDEYHLNRLIFHFPKPYIALLNGITMGGGVGVSIHGSHRVATDKLLFAMPETGIGFFPDVGGTYFLPRLEGYIGYYLGLTGARLKSDDCVALGVAQQKVPQDSLSDLIKALAEEPYHFDAKVAVTKIIERFKTTISPSDLMDMLPIIDKCFSPTTMEEILQALHHHDHPFTHDTANTIVGKSPTSLKVTLRALQEGKHLDFDTCMRHEFRLSKRFLQGHDFPEGIRAVIIDKDYSPHWMPSTLHEVTRQEVEKYFAMLETELL